MALYSTGISFDDTLEGTEAADTLVGKERNTAIAGYGGDDDLTGVDPTYYGAGNGEYDILSGGYGADYFYVGDEYEAYYQGEGSVEIVDFISSEGDKIVAYGVAEDYSYVEIEGGLRLDYLDDPVAYFDSVTTLSTSDFIFL